MDPYGNYWDETHDCYGWPSETVSRPLLLDFKYLQAKLAATDTNALIAGHVRARAGALM